MVAAITPVKKVLVLGAYGMLGHDLQRVFPDAVFRGHDLDITDQKKVTAAVREIKPTLVINAAAYTDVDGCEDHRDLAFTVNGEALFTLSGACRDAGACLIHYSTDYVFDGTQTILPGNRYPQPHQCIRGIKIVSARKIFRRRWTITGSSVHPGFSGHTGRISLKR